MVLVAFPLLALAYTHSAMVIAGVAAAGRLPALIVGLPVGALADRLNRRRMIVSIEIARFGVIGVFSAAVATHTGGVAVLFVAAAVLGSLNIAFDVTSSACLPSVVESDQLVSANARLFNAQVTGQGMIGQAVGGVLFSVARALPFLADALSFTASAFLLKSAIPDNEISVRQVSVWADLLEGLRWFFENRVLRILSGLVATLAFCQAMVFAVLVIYATGRLGLTAGGFGLLMAVAFIGDVIGSLAAPKLHSKLGGGVCIIGAAALSAACYPVLALTRSAAVAGLILIIEGIAVVVGMVAYRSKRQSLVGPEMQGRAASASNTIVLGVVPLGGLLGGLITAQFGIQATLVASGLAQLAIVALVTPRLLTRFRAEPMMIDLTGEPLEEQKIEALAS